MDIDGLIERSATFSVFEIKSGMSLNEESFEGLLRWQTISGTATEDTYLIYARSENYSYKNISVLSWRNFFNDVVQTLV